MRGNGFQGVVRLQQAANDPGLPRAPRRRTLPMPNNDNRQPFWQRWLVRFLSLITVMSGGIACYFYQGPVL